MRALLMVLAVASAPTALAGAYLEGGIGTAGFSTAGPLDMGRQQMLGGGACFRSDATVIRAGGALVYSQHNGMHFNEQGEQIAPSGLTQGDTLLLSLVGRFDLAFLVHPRLGLGFRADLGLGVAPLLMERSAYLDQVVSGEWNGSESALHSGVHPVARVGPQLTWYTPAGVGVGLHTGLTYRSHLGVGYVGAVQLSWEGGTD